MFKRKLFSELNAGDYVYWVYKRRNFLANVLVEKYKILEIKHKNNGELEFKLTHDFYLVANPHDMVSSREEDSFFAIDEEGIEWAVDKIKRKKMKEYQNRITTITEEMCNIMKAPYIMYDKT